MTAIATCHCGGTRIEIDQAPTRVTRCTCTFCSKSGALWAYYRPEDPRIVSDEHTAMYSASDGINRHHFCARCGCRTYSLSPDWSLPMPDDSTMPEVQRIAINARLLDDVDVASLEVEVFNLVRTAPTPSPPETRSPGTPPISSPSSRRTRVPRAQA